MEGIADGECTLILKSSYLDIGVGWSWEGHMRGSERGGRLRLWGIWWFAERALDLMEYSEGGCVAGAA